MDQLTSACKDFSKALQSSNVSSAAHYEHGRIVGDNTSKPIVYRKGRTLLVVRRDSIGC